MPDEAVVPAVRVPGEHRGAELTANLANVMIEQTPISPPITLTSRPK
jgi:hypothetical protein